MKVYTEIVIDMVTDEIVSETSYEYDGPIAKADFGGGGGGAFSAASDAQVQAMQMAIAEQEKMYQQTRADLGPYRGAGEQALPYYAGILNIPGYDKVDPTAALQATPGYQWLLNQGQQAMTSKGLATGQYGSGAFEKGLMNYGQNLANTYAYQPYMSQVGGLATMGQNAAAQTGTFGQNTANQISSLMTGIGNAQAQGILGQYAAGQQSQSGLLGGLGMLGGLGLGALGLPVGGGMSLLGSIMGGSGW